MSAARRGAAAASALPSATIWAAAALEVAAMKVASGRLRSSHWATWGLATGWVVKVRMSPRRLPVRTMMANATSISISW